MSAVPLINSLLSYLNMASTEEKKIEHDLSDYSTLPILVTGGAGFIGSHTVIELINAGFTQIIIVDNFVNSSMESISRVKQIVKDKNAKITHYDLDIATQPIK